MKKSIFSALGSLAFAVLASGLPFHTAAAQDITPRQLPAASPTGWGSGPIMASLLISARREAPIRGVEPAPALIAPVQDATSLPSEKVEPVLPSALSVERMELSMAAARTIDFEARANREIALAKH